MVTTIQERHLFWHMRSILACSFDTIHTIEFAEVIRIWKLQLTEYSLSRSILYVNILVFEMVEL